MRGCPGVPLRTADGHNLGTLCVIDHQPRHLTDVQRQALEALGTQVVRLLEARRSRRETTPRTMTIAPSADEVDPGLRPEFTRGSRLALLIMVLLAVGTIASSIVVHQVVHGAERVRLGHATLRAARFLEDRANTYEEILRGAAALTKSSMARRTSSSRSTRRDRSRSRTARSGTCSGTTRRSPSRCRSST